MTAKETVISVIIAFCLSGGIVWSIIDGATTASYILIVISLLWVQFLIYRRERAVVCQDDTPIFVNQSQIKILGYELKEVQPANIYIETKSTIDKGHLNTLEKKTQL